MLARIGCMGEGMKDSFRRGGRSLSTRGMGAGLASTAQAISAVVGSSCPKE